MRSYLRQLTLKCTVYFQHVLLGDELAAAAVAAAAAARDTPDSSLSVSRMSQSQHSLTSSTLSVGSMSQTPAGATCTRVRSLIEHSALQRLLDDWHRKQPQLAARTSLHVVNVLRSASATSTSVVSSPSSGVGPVSLQAAGSWNWNAFACVASGYQVPVADAAVWQSVARELSAAAPTPVIVSHAAGAAPNAPVRSNSQRQLSSDSEATASTLTRSGGVGVVGADVTRGGEQVAASDRLLADISREMEEFVIGGFMGYSFVFSHPPVRLQSPHTRTYIRICTVLCRYTIRIAFALCSISICCWSASQEAARLFGTSYVTPTESEFGAAVEPPEALAQAAAEQQRWRPFVMELTLLVAHVRSLSDPRQRSSVLYLSSRSTASASLSATGSASTAGLPLGLYVVALDAQLDALPAHLLLLALHPLPVDSLVSAAAAASSASSSLSHSLSLGAEQRTGAAHGFARPPSPAAVQRIEFDKRVESFLLQLAAELHASQTWTQLPVDASAK